jgi:hypothetical protein
VKAHTIVLPQPSDFEPHSVAPQTAGVQHCPAAVHTSPEPQFVEQSMVPPQPSEAVVLHTPVGQVVCGVQPQMPELHGPFEQSPSAPHFLPGAHVAPQLPPQSTSVSAPFITPSVQLAD